MLKLALNIFKVFFFYICNFFFPAKKSKEANQVIKRKMAPSSYTKTTNQAKITFGNRHNAIEEETSFLTRRGSLKRFFDSAKGYTIGGSTKSGPKLALYQGIIFGTLFLGYASYTYARKIFSYAAPTLMTLGLLSQNNMGKLQFP